MTHNRACQQPMRHRGAEGKFLDQEYKSNLKNRLVLIINVSYSARYETKKN